ncbi:hypothetical protein LV779_09705 [Streptomyces thinghirensis]|nr:hypothetical protein [Streptomyces thinghirensis]
MDAGRTDAGHGADTERGGEGTRTRTGRPERRRGRPAGRRAAGREVHDAGASRAFDTARPPACRACGVQDRPAHTCPDAPAPTTEFRAGGDVDVDLTV